jgi:hypothetical protein
MFYSPLFEELSIKKQSVCIALNANVFSICRNGKEKGCLKK